MSSSFADGSAGADAVPIVHALSEIYDDVHAATRRYSALASRFHGLYGTAPTFYARAPGRVNLIGEHVDYCGFSVLPMAIDRDTVMAACITQTQHIATADPHPVQLANYDARYDATTYNDNWSLFVIDGADAHSWTKYFQCGFKGIFNAVKNGGDSEILTDEHSSSVSDSDYYAYKHHSLQLLVSGTVPPSAGLSSSSSLVCCSALTAAFAHSFHSRFNRHQLSEICCQCERYVGTMGGGMDQSISFLSERGLAQRIDFDPLVNTPVQLPASAVFVVCNSLYESEKAVQAAKQFNLRVLECKVSALMIAKYLRVKISNASKCTLKSVLDQSGQSMESMLTLLRSEQSPFHPQPYTVSEIEAALSLSLTDTLAYNPNFAKVLSQQPVLKLYDRSVHVYSEALRVHQFQSVCSASGDISLLGRLMNESHSSCRDQYECSCEDLEVLIGIVRSVGASGARLTGAGWGGCAVALFDGRHGQSSITEAMNEIKRRYYKEYKGIELDDPRLSEFIFTTKPAAGAAIYVPPAPPVVKEGSMKAMFLRWGIILGLGALTGWTAAILSHRRHARLVHSTGHSTAGTFATAAVDATASGTHSTLPMIK